MDAMDLDTAVDKYDLLLLTDATGSMGAFIQGLNKSLQEIIDLAALTACFERIGVACYRDYQDTPITEWSGWCSPSGYVSGEDIKSQQHVIDMASNIQASGGGDLPEAAKSGLALAYSKMREEATTIILIYADAPPHFWGTGGANREQEIKALRKETGTFSEFDELFSDWATAARTLRHGQRRAVVFPIIAGGDGSMESFHYLAHITGGTCLNIGDVSSQTISTVTVGLLLTWMRAGEAFGTNSERLGSVPEYKEDSTIYKPTDEDDFLLREYFPRSLDSTARQLVNRNVSRRKFTLGDLSTLITARGPNTPPLREKYESNAAYKELATEILRKLIASNVAIISLNPIFGTLWRAVCNDRSNEARDKLVEAFSYRVGLISDQNEKERLKLWLENSYDYAGELNGLIEAVEPSDRFPQVYLDPTQDFSTAPGEHDEEAAKPINKFTRSELLEIGRSCDYKILRRLGRVLTRLSFADSEDMLPSHIKSASQTEIPRIPLAMAQPKYEMQFWKILLHAILPGTKLAARPAALLAALALRMSIKTLRDAGDSELYRFHTFWRKLDVPETWSPGCLNLLLDADADFKARVASGVTSPQNPSCCILSDGDRELFQAIIDYKMLELNLDTTIEATIGWHPEKTLSALGPLEICKACAYPRSVTVMAADGVCGLCETTEREKCNCSACERAANHDKTLVNNVTKSTTEASRGHWVECFNPACRAQYIVYNPQDLNVRAKCFYCRHANGKFGAAPTVECRRCSSRIIWPTQYRPNNFESGSYECVACVNGMKTTVIEEISARDLSRENGYGWLLANADNAISSPFNGRSIFQLVSKCDLDILVSNIAILPETNIQLAIRGKPLLNNSEARDQLRQWVKSRKTEQSTCSLCFSSVRKFDVVRACGRSGCHQRICYKCRENWYGLNRKGRIVNLAALSCPFCRRQPTHKAAPKYQAAGIPGLAVAIQESGEWIHAWCSDCGQVQRVMERVCARGAPADDGSFQCTACVTRRQDTIWTVSCPGCGVETEKLYGCDHILCPCGTHWCYLCGNASSENEIYDHIANEHGGVEFEVDYEYDEDEDDDYDGQ